MISSLDMGSWVSRAPGTPPLIVGHRGASALAPENSVTAFERAAADGADGVELDVLLCATGEPVVFHDDDLVRLAGRRERIAALSWAELREVRLSSGATIPTLEEAIEACGRALLVNVELKASGISTAGMRRLVDAVERAIARAGAGGRVLISSFHPRALRIWQGRAPSIPAGFLFEGGGWRRASHAGWLAWLRPASAHPESGLCTRKAVRRWQRRGYRVNVWTVDDAVELRRLRDLGVDGIITNDPAGARRALQPG